MAEYLIGVAVPLTLMGLVVLGRWVRTILHQLDQVHALAVDVNSAVNHRPSGDPKLYDMVKEAGVHAKENGDAAARLEQQFADHSRSDEINFADIRARLARMPQTPPASQT